MSLAAVLPVRRDDAVLGILLVAGGYVIVACSDAAVKWALPQVGIAAALLWRGVFGAIAVAILARGAVLRPVNRRLIATRSLLHCVVSCAFYAAWFLGLPLADTYAVGSASPLIMTLLAIPMLGEKVGWRRWSSTLLGFAGVLVMLQPGGSLWRWEISILLAAIALMALTRLWTRVLGRTDTPATITFWLMLAHITVGLALLPVLPPPGWAAGGAWLPGWSTMLVLAAMGAGNAMAHMLFARAFAIAPVSALAPLEYSPLVWGVPLGLVIWGDFPAPATFAGAAIVIAAGLYNLYRERLRARQARGLA